MTTTDGKNMNRWLYRAAGTVGVAGGFLLLGTGGVHADQAGGPQDASGEAFAPTSGLPPLNLSAANPAAPEAAPAGSPELLDGLPLDGLPLDGLPLDGLPLDGLPLGGLPLDGLPLGGLPGGPLATDNLLQIKGQPDALPASADQVPALIADQLAAERNWSPGQFPGDASAEQGDLVDGLPLVGNALQPITGLVNVGNLPAQLPLVGPLAGPALGALPVVEDPLGSAPAALPPAMSPSGETVDGRPIVDEYPEYSW